MFERIKRDKNYWQPYWFQFIKYGPNLPLRVEHFFLYCRVYAICFFSITAISIQSSVNMSFVSAQRDSDVNNGIIYAYTKWNVLCFVVSMQRIASTVAFICFCRPRHQQMPSTQSFRQYLSFCVRVSSTLSQLLKFTQQ